MRNKQNGDWIVQIVDFFFEVSFDTQLLKVLVFASDLEFWIVVNQHLDVYVIAHTTQQIDTSKLVRQWKSKEWANSDWECLLLISIYSSSKFKVTSMNADFDCRYIGTNIKEKPS